MREGFLRPEVLTQGRGNTKMNLANYLIREAYKVTANWIGRDWASILSSVFCESLMPLKSLFVIIVIIDIN